MQGHLINNHEASTQGSYDTGQIYEHQRNDMMGLQTVSTGCFSEMYPRKILNNFGSRNARSILVTVLAANRKTFHI